MNLLARILSHGFALALVALIAIALMYRGELFPEWELPDFLVVDDSPDSGQAETSSEEIQPQTEAAATSPGSAVKETTGAVVVPPAAFQDSTVASEPAADHALDDSAQEAPVASDDGTDEPVDTDPAGLIQSEPDSGDQSASDNDAIDSGAVDSSASEPVADAVTPVAEAEDVPQQADTDIPVAEAEEASPQVIAVPPAAEVEEASPQVIAVPPAAEVEEASPQVNAVPPAVEAEEAPQPADAVPPVPEAAVSADMTPVEEEAQQLVPAAEATTSQVAPEAPEPVATEESGDVATMPGSVAVTPEPVIPEEPPVAQTEPSQASVPTPASPLPDSSAAAEVDREKTAHELLAAAREAYWLRDYDGAEKYYSQLIELEPDNPDGYGELGNMYFAQGQWDEAAAAYYETGVRLINEGMTVQARQLVDVIRGLNGKQADELEKQVDAASRNTP